ncbi:helix-turn-helix transcriptional regulator [Actinoplanes sp. NPDC049596]|uniref:helix-turn-helix transcriptional regulator n=1 Tax=unclassified Actinoplanes TaxID=2626549 RepID=UPI003446778B
MISIFETDDLDRAYEILTRTYARARITVTGDRIGMRIVRTDLGPVSLDHVTFTMSHRTELAPMGQIAIGRARAGRVCCRTGRDTTENGAGDLFLGNQPDSVLRTESENHEGEYARFPPAVFARVADAAPGRAAQPIRFTGYRPMSARAALFWAKTYDHVRDYVGGLSPEDEPLLVGSAVQMLASVTLSAFPNTALSDPTIEDRHDAHPATVRRAVRFIEDYAHLDITPADIAATARVTIRALQLAFRRHLGTTPTALLRRVRLEQAHRQLLAADPATTTVSAVAMQWGFASHSTFTAHYREAYGVLPSVTLRRR